MIKCEHCNWTGSIADGQSHEQKCRKARSRRSRYVRSDSDKDLIDTLKAAKVALENDKAELEDELNEMVHQLNLREAIVETQDYRCRSLQGENGRLSQQVSELEFQNSKLQMETQKLEQIGKLMQNQRERPLIRNTGAYDYDRFTVVRLTKLICQDLENKPTEINANKIFDCVRCIYQDFERGYNDSPDNLYIDVRMLLAVCMASTWFTPRQEENYERWMSEEGWC
ncbi:expressed unknown protein [Seminavis robusta]|uniref:Uncharacterized protein n=1 Tax=Seminavis robusta TaxID=568900 RepID=A0A9N8D6V9_9STRA|nr:expressed unknown protein [Seminavis robusta]|eukprot:Sro4_g002950.1 n/a (226) ;mRNA; r:17041-17718